MGPIEIPSDNHIRQTLDSVPPQTLFPRCDAVLESLLQAGHLESWRTLRAILLGDDLYAHQPFCRRALLEVEGFDFIFFCKPDSHPTLYSWVNLLQRPDLGPVSARVKVATHFHTYAYRCANSS